MFGVKSAGEFFLQTGKAAEEVSAGRIHALPRMVEFVALRRTRLRERAERTWRDVVVFSPSEADCAAARGTGFRSAKTTTLLQLRFWGSAPIHRFRPTHYYFAGIALGTVETAGSQRH